MLFLNEGGDKFRQKTDAFQVPPALRRETSPEPRLQTMTRRLAGYLLCLYVYYQGTDQYKLSLSLLRRRERAA